MWPFAEDWNDVHVCPFKSEAQSPDICTFILHCMSCVTSLKQDKILFVKSSIVL